MNVRRTRTALTTAAVAGPLALGLVACGGDGDDDRAADTVPASAERSTTTSDPAPAPESGSTTDPSGSSGSSGSSAPTGDVPAAVARTALGAVEGTVFGLDSDDGVWDVTVVRADGSEWDLEVSADGSTVVREPREDLDDDGDDDAADDLAERQTLLADARVGLTEALTTARAEVPGVEVTGLDLDLDRGRPVWDVQLGEDTADEHEVTLDAVTGDVVRVERDD